MRKPLFLLLAVWLSAFAGAGEDLVAVPGLGLRVTPNFRVTLFAGPELAADIYAMTLDSHGRVVVTGPGYIKRLDDTRHVGRADKAVLFATTKTGGMGLCFDGNDLMFFGDGALSRYRDTNGDGIADGPPEKIASFGNSEHGAHAIRQGPDGFWYLIGGNDSGFARTPPNVPDSHVAQAEAGALLRFSPDGQSRQIMADGFRNPYDFDFNAIGDIFTFDSDVERDYFLPWYTPTRLYHVAIGGHHGWRLEGYKRSWNRPWYSPDVTDILVEVGRGSPTGLACYRHYKFPEHYQQGLFGCDWTFGRVYFFPLEYQAGEYRSQAEVFLEPSGTQGFAPTDIVVAPDGSLFICTGGRKTRGSVYRVEYVGPKPQHTPSVTTPLDRVIKALQPLDAWSRARWMPEARKLGARAFVHVIEDASYSPEQKVRAVEVLTEMFGGLGLAAKDAAQHWHPLVRARAAWSLEFKPTTNALTLLLELASDPDIHVCRCALDALSAHQGQIKPVRLPALLPPGLESDDKRLRQAAARMASKLPATEWRTVWDNRNNLSARGRLTLALAALWRPSESEVHLQEASFLVSCLEARVSSDLKLDAVRLLILALGDYNLHHPSVEVYTGYELPRSLAAQPALVGRILDDLHTLFPSGNPALNIEASRLMAMLRDPDPEAPFKVVENITRESSATADFHAFTVLSRLAPSLDAKGVSQVSRAILRLDRKLGDRQTRIKQNWTERLVEVSRELIAHYSSLADDLLRNPEFPTPGHLSLVDAFEPAQRQRAAGIYLQAVKLDRGFVWSQPLLELFGLATIEELRPLLRQQWSNVLLRDDILLRLAQKPEAFDREKFMQGLESANPGVVFACLTALQNLPREPAPQNVAALVRAVEKLSLIPGQKEIRMRAMALLDREAGKAFGIRETGTNAAAIANDYVPVIGWFTNAYPLLAKKIALAGSETPESLREELKNVSPDSGDASRGSALFLQRGCQACHAAADAMGPDLAGAAGRMSMEDLFTAIVFPSKDIAPAYLPDVIQTRDNQYAGLVAFESADGVILRTGPSQTVRVSADAIIWRRPSSVSLMPTGLLQGLKPEDLADLYAYLKSLGPTQK